jgi:hypothetical protein
MDNVVPEPKAIRMSQFNNISASAGPKSEAFCRMSIAPIVDSGLHTLFIRWMTLSTHLLYGCVGYRWTCGKL